jgi:hypothetical protein
MRLASWGVQKCVFAHLFGDFFSFLFLFKILIYNCLRLLFAAVLAHSLRTFCALFYLMCRFFCVVSSNESHMKKWSVPYY